MRGAKFFGVVIACILTSLLAAEAGFISVTWAAKPSDKGKPPSEESQTLPWGVNWIDADEVWGTTRGAGIRVAVLHDGIDIYHPDLEVAGGIDTVGDGVPSTDPNDYNTGNYNGGTVSAGIIAALDNTFGVIGVAPEVELYAVKFRELPGAALPDQTGFNYLDLTTYIYTDLYEGMQWCINNDMQVISIGFGIWTMDRHGNRVYPLHDPEFYRLIVEAHRKGIVMVAASGDEDREIGNWGDLNTPDLPHASYPDKGYDFPASYQEVIGISATKMIETTKGKRGERDKVLVFASDSPYGPGLDLAAPGGALSTNNGGGYANYGGTGVASSHVAGVVALVLAEYPLMSPGEVRDHLMATAEPLPEIDPTGKYGAGLVDAEWAVKTAPGSPAPARYTVSPIGKLSVTWGKLKSD